MRSVPASFVKQNFGEVLARAALEPVGIERHRKLVAALVSPEVMHRLDALDERKSAREQQKRVEMERLSRHQQIAIDLLCAGPAGQRATIAAALGEVSRWESGRLCSTDYIRRWRRWLSLPVKRLAVIMCGDAEGWGPAMRQNSPFAIAK